MTRPALSTRLTLRAILEREEQRRHYSSRSTRHDSPHNPLQDLNKTRSGSRHWNMRSSAGEWQVTRMGRCLTTAPRQQVGQHMAGIKLMHKVRRKHNILFGKSQGRRHFGRHKSRCQISNLMLIIRSERNNCFLLYCNITNAMENRGLLEELMV